jgi:hypothetical protein
MAHSATAFIARMPNYFVNLQAGGASAVEADGNAKHDLN